MSQQPSRRQTLAAVIGSTVGTTIEWYDFFLYGTAAALIFPRAFFPAQTPFLGEILSFSTFSVGFLSRPLGGVIFGRLGDRQGRKVALVATLLLMGASTLAIGFLPDYHQMGVAAPLALVALRFLQGIGVGGEWGGAVLLALETGDPRRRGTLASWPQVGVPLGLLLSTGAMALCQIALPPADFLAWGWRIPFLASALLILVGLLIRSLVTESPAFLKLKTSQQIAKTPLRETLRHHWREILLGAGSRLSENSVFYLFATHLLTYGQTRLKLSREATITLTAVNAAAAVACFTIPLFGRLSDHWPRKRVYQAGNLLLLVLAVPYYALLETQQPWAILLATIVMLGVVHALLYGVQAALISELFTTRLRYTGASLAYQLAGPLAGGMAPLVATTLAHEFPNTYLPLAAYIAAMAIISLVSVHGLARLQQAQVVAKW